MGWFSKAPAEPTKLTMEEIATIVIKDTEALLLGYLLSQG